MTFLEPVYTEKTECQDCYKCVRECPVKAISVENGSAIIISDLCILCGHCVEVCPVNAKKVRDDLKRAKQLLKLKEQVIVSLAPSFVSEFSGIKSGQLIRALKTLGFYGVSETALGAQEVSAHTAEILNTDEPRFFLSSACPTVVEYIKKYRPEYTPYITDFLSPVLSHCKFLRRKYGNQIGIVFIGPCISKKRESDLHPELLNVALTFNELKRWFREEHIDLKTIVEMEGDSFIPMPAKEGALYPIDGGMISGIKANSSICDTGFMSFSGMSIIKEALNGLNELNLKANLFIELLACEGGCVNGPMVEKRSAIAIKRYRVIDYVEYLPSVIPRKPEVPITENLIPEPVETHKYSEDRITEALRKIGKYSDKDELNCGGCGYNTCRDFAQALLAGKAEVTMCVSYMRKLAQKKANALIKTMPSGVVIVDENLKIVESNQNFAHIMGNEVEMIYSAVPGLEGASLEKIASFSNLFKSVLKTGKDIIDRNIQFKNSILNISIFTIEKHRLVGGVIQDITVPSVRKEQIIKKAKEVIRKNLTTVQKIAYLLGENASETEIILSSIIEAFSSKSMNDFEDQ